MKLQKKKMAKIALKENEEMNKEIQDQENLKEWIAEVIAQPFVETTYFKDYDGSCPSAEPTDLSGLEGYGEVQREDGLYKGQLINGKYDEQGSGT